MFDDMQLLKRILNDQTPREVKKIHQWIKGFDGVKCSKEGKSVCYLGIKTKFDQNKLLNTVLYNTGSAIIIECTHNKLCGARIPLSHQSALDEKLRNNWGWMSEILEYMQNELSIQCSK